jgi:hypothetical protein
MLKSAQTTARPEQLVGPLDRLPPAERRFLERLFKKIRAHLSEPGRPANPKFTTDEMLCLFPELKARLIEVTSNPDDPGNRLLELGALRFKNVNDRDCKGLRKSSGGLSAHAAQNSKSPIERKPRKSSIEPANASR